MRVRLGCFMLAVSLLIAIAAPYASAEPVEIVRNGGFTAGIEEWILNPEVGEWNPWMEGGKIDLYALTETGLPGVIMYQNLNVTGIEGKALTASITLTNQREWSYENTVAVCIVYIDADGRPNVLTLLNPDDAAIGTDTVFTNTVTLPANARKIVRVEIDIRDYSVLIGDDVSLKADDVAAGPVPIITSVSPDSGPYGTSVTLNGTGFGPTQGSVMLNGSDEGITITGWTDTAVTLTIGSPASSGTVLAVCDSVETNIDKTFTVTSPHFLAEVRRLHDTTFVKGVVADYVVKVTCINGFTPPGGFQLSTGLPGAELIMPTMPGAGGAMLRIDTSSLSAGLHESGVLVDGGSMQRTAPFTINVVEVGDIKFFTFDSEYNYVYITELNATSLGRLDLNWEVQIGDGTILFSVPVTFQSSNTSVILPIFSGGDYWDVYALSAGTANLIATTPDGFTKTLPITVTLSSVNQILSISVTPSTIANTFADTITFNAIADTRIYEIYRSGNATFTDFNLSWDNNVVTQTFTQQLDPPNNADVVLFGAKAGDAEGLAVLTITSPPPIACILTGRVISIDDSMPHWVVYGANIEFYQDGEKVFEREVWMSPMDGAFQIDALPAGTYKLRCVPTPMPMAPQSGYDYVQALPQWYLNADSISQAAEVTFSTEQPTDDIFFFILGDHQAPEVDSFSAPDVTTADGTSYEFTVTYRDNLAVSASDLWDSTLLVSGPNDFSASPSCADVDQDDSGTPLVATYFFDAPGGAWAAGHNGTYAIDLPADTVADTSHNPLPPQRIGTFEVKIPSWPIPGDANCDCKVNLLDLLYVRNRLNQSVTTLDNILADVNEDGKINLLDLLFVRNRLNQQC